jgi:hypothetical protein
VVISTRFSCVRGRSKTRKKGNYTICVCRNAAFNLIIIANMPPFTYHSSLLGGEQTRYRFCPTPRPISEFIYINKSCLIFGYETIFERASEVGRTRSAMGTPLAEKAASERAHYRERYGQIRYSFIHCSRLCSQYAFAYNLQYHRHYGHHLHSFRLHERNYVCGFWRSPAHWPFSLLLSALSLMAFPAANFVGRAE